MEILILICSVFLIFVMILLSVAFLSLFERKFMGYIQFRKGPNIVGQFGLFQPFSDALKLISKTDFSPEKSWTVSFYLPPILFFFVSLMVWVVFPVKFNFFSFQQSGLFLIFSMSLSVYGLIFSGWYSYSKFSNFGLCRAIAQTISYEIVLTFSMFGIFLIYGSVCLKSIFLQGSGYFFSFFLGFVFFISLLAEANRTPFDLPEGESELVGGYSVEYGSVSYTLLFLGENLALLFSSVLMVIFFMGSSVFLLKFSMFLVFFIWIRASLPRIRFDKIVNLCWYELVPITLGMIFFCCVLI